MKSSLKHDSRVGIVLKNHGYVQKCQVGQGTSGSAILVERTSDKAKFVCKVVDLSVAFASETAAAKKETKLLADLRHPYIVGYQESFHEDGWLCIIMDYCEGGDVSSHIERARMQKHSIPENQVLLWLSQALLALKYVHENHILHRDLKPGNLFITKAGDLKLGDFGISKVLSSTAAYTKTQIGTPYYLSPEVCKDQPYSWGSDIWALGCVVYQLCALRVPFDATKLSELVRKICHDPTPVLPSMYSKELRQIFSDMLIRDPQRRPSAAELLQRPVVQAQLGLFLSKVQISQHVGAFRGNGKARNDASTAESLPKESMHTAQNDNTSSHVDAPYRSSAGTFKKGDRIQYKSETHNEWLSGVVIASYPDGQIIIDLKPRRVLSIEIQAARVRPSQAYNEPRQAESRGPVSTSFSPAWAKEPYKPSWQVLSPRAGGLFMNRLDANRQLREASAATNLSRDAQESPGPRGFKMKPGGDEDRKALPLIPMSQRNSSNLRPQIGQYPSQISRGQVSCDVKYNNARALPSVTPQRQLRHFRDAGAAMMQ